VVVDHVENDTHAEAVCRVDERAEIVGRTVQPAWGKQVYAVVTPAEPPRKVGDRHDLEHGDAEVGEQRQFFDRRPERPRGSEGTDM
jgi:hypothetical protein